MTRVSMWCVSVVLSLSAAALYAQTPALDIRMGLWEVTTDSAAASQVVQTDPGSVERRAGTNTNVSKVCMTKDTLAKTFFVLPANQACTRLIAANTSSMLDASVACSGVGATSSQVHLEALSPTSVKGTVNSASTGAGGFTTSSKTIAAKWLSADCRDQK